MAPDIAGSSRRAAVGIEQQRITLSFFVIKRVMQYALDLFVVGSYPTVDGDISLGLVRETADMALKALGFGPRRGDDNRSINTLVIQGVEPALLERARARLRANAVSEEPEDAEPPVLPAPG